MDGGFVCRGSTYVAAVGSADKGFAVSGWLAAFSPFLLCFLCVRRGGEGARWVFSGITCMQWSFSITSNAHDSIISRFSGEGEVL